MTCATRSARDVTVEGTVRALANHLGLSGLLADLKLRFGSYELLHHWTQGEFHHDLVVDVGSFVLVVSTNCNGGVKEVMAFDEVPDRWALWHWRVPDNPEFEGQIPALRARTTTVHHFDPAELLRPDARSEIKPEHRRRARGGGWELAD